MEAMRCTEIQSVACPRCQHVCIVIGSTRALLFSLYLIMFGLIFSTVLTLGVVPVLYSLFFKVSYKDFLV